LSVYCLGGYYGEWTGVCAPLLIDGVCGAKTMDVAHEFGVRNGFPHVVATGIREDFWAALEATYNKCPKFVIITDAGHGGIHPETKQYMTPPENGKRYTHKGARLHFGADTFYEGYENRILANAFEKEMEKYGVLVHPCYHPYLDWWGTNSNSQELARRANFAEPYLKRGFVGYYHSFHSNAIGKKVKNKAGEVIRIRTQEEIDQTQGGIVFTAPGVTLSDIVSTYLIEEWKKEIGDEWVWNKNENPDGDEANTTESDYEDKFAVLTGSEALASKYAAYTVNAYSGECKRFTDLVMDMKWRGWAAILQEGGFFTSRIDAERIIQPGFRGNLVKCAVAAALRFYGLFFKK